MKLYATVFVYKVGEGVTLSPLVQKCGYSAPTKADPVARREQTIDLYDAHFLVAREKNVVRVIVEFPEGIAAEDQETVMYTSQLALLCDLRDADLI